VWNIEERKKERIGREEEISFHEIELKPDGVVGGRLQKDWLGPDGMQRRERSSSTYTLYSLSFIERECRNFGIDSYHHRKGKQATHLELRFHVHVLAGLSQIFAQKKRELKHRCCCETQR